MNDADKPRAEVLQEALAESMRRNGDQQHRREGRTATMSKEEKPGLHFDPTVSLSDILVALTMLTAGFFAYSNLDKRVAVNEASAALIAQQASAQQVEQKSAINEVRADVKDVQRSINEIGRVLASRKP